MPPTERRNLYRLLHVQPEAPAEVLKASYRVLMSSLRVHPDLGGSHEQAAQLNAAYAVLSDPPRRLQYDQALRRKAPQRSAATAQPTLSPSAWREARRCPLCSVPLTLLAPRNPRCARCESPLTPAPNPEVAEAELLGRRKSQRYERPQDALMRTADGPEGVAVRVKNLSMTGMALLARAPLKVGQAIRVQASGFDAVAEVMALTRQGPRLAVHAKLLSLQVLRQSRGTLVDTQA